MVLTHALKTLTSFTGLLGAIAIATVATPVNAALVNGGLNEDGLNGWTVVSSGLGSWNETSGGTIFFVYPIPAPSEGTGYAVTNQRNFSSNVLFQDIALEANAQHLLSFDWFAQDWSNSFADAGTLSKYVFPNQHFRVDLVSTDFTDWFGPDSSIGLLANILPPTADNAPIDRWNSLSFDLTPWAGQSVRLAFRQVDNQGVFNAGVDNVQIQSRPTEKVPEPTSALTLVAVGLLAARYGHQPQTK